MSENPHIDTMTKGDFDLVVALWRQTEGLVLNESDSREAFEQFLDRNPDLSLVVRSDSVIIAAVLCGHDGRRGYLHHLAVSRGHRRNGIGKRLVQACLTRLHALQISKCNVYLLRGNGDGRLFWERNGWCSREDLNVMQRRTSLRESGLG